MTSKALYHLDTGSSLIAFPPDLNPFIGEAMRKRTFNGALRDVADGVLAYLGRLFQRVYIQSARELEDPVFALAVLTNATRANMPKIFEIGDGINNPNAARSAFIAFRLLGEVRNEQEKRAAEYEVFKKSFLEQFQKREIPYHGRIPMTSKDVEKYIMISTEMYPPSEETGGYIVLSINETFEVNLEYLLMHFEDAKRARNATSTDNLGYTRRVHDKAS